MTEQRVAQHFARALDAHRSGRLPEAQRLYEEILRREPRHYDALHNAAVLAGQRGDYPRAAELLGRAIVLAPARPGAYRNRALALKNMGCFEAALLDLERVNALEGADARGEAQCAELLLKLGRAAEARRRYERALELEPGLVDAHLGHGVACERLGDAGAALASYESALALRSDSAEAHYNRAHALLELERLEDALASYDEAIRLKERFYEAHFNRGVVLARLMQIPAARASYEQALALDRGSAPAHFHRATTLLACGELAEGWREYEWRFAYTGSSPKVVGSTARSEPLWRGEPLADRTLLIHAEQGLGDTLQFCRFVAPLAARGARVLLHVQRPLARLLASLAGVAQVCGADEPPPEFDLHCPLLSVPAALGTSLASLPGPVPYLAGPPEAARRWRGRLGVHTRLRVGLVWSGGVHPTDAEARKVNLRRNLPPALYVHLALSGVELFSLQKGDSAAADVAALNALGVTLVDHTSELIDLAETAALIANLDLVISVDTSIAHLAGALGKPVWILNRFDACWRWLLDRRDSPWYPTAKVYRQARPGDWNSVMEEVAADLAALAGTAAPG